MPPSKIAVLAYLYDGLSFDRIAGPRIIKQQLPDSSSAIMLGHLARALGFCRAPLLEHVEELRAGLAFLQALAADRQRGFGWKRVCQ